jgi:cell division protein ZapA (FtsZ GTPase activity inhibitor)
MFFKKKNPKISDEDCAYAMSRFILTLKELLMKEVNQHITDMKEVIKNAVLQVVLEEVSLESLSMNNTNENRAALERIHRKVDVKVRHIVDQHAVLAMDRISRHQQSVVAQESKAASSKKRSGKK